MSYYEEKVTNEDIEKMLINSENLIRVINGKVIQFGDRFGGEFAYKDREGRYCILKKELIEYNYRNNILNKGIKDTDIEEVKDYEGSDLEECVGYYIGSSDNYVDFLMKIEGCIYIFTHIFNGDVGKYFCNVVYNMKLESLVYYKKGNVGDILWSIDDDLTRDKARDELEIFIEDYV